jgi:tripartite-type tricarboxylate transporter receptor subunit TctC
LIAAGIARGALAAAVLIATHNVIAAETYPSRPVRLIVPAGAGGVTDILGRVVAAKLTESMGQQVIVDNRPGASGIVGSQIVAKAAPDGHTLLMVFPSHPVNPALYPDIPYDTLTAFAPISMVSAVAPVLIVSSAFPAKSVKDLIALARAKPGQLNHGSVGSGSMGALAAELLRTMAGIRFTQVAYKGSPQALTALISGELDFYLIGSASTVVPQVKAGRVRAIGVGARQRLPIMPDVPSIGETVPGYDVSLYYGVSAPRGTPPDVVAILNKAINTALADPKMKRRIAEFGGTPLVLTPGGFGKLIADETVKWEKVVNTVGLAIE